MEESAIPLGLRYRLYWQGRKKNIRAAVEEYLVAMLRENPVTYREIVSKHGISPVTLAFQIHRLVRLGWISSLIVVEDMLCLKPDQNRKKGEEIAAE